MKQINRSVFLKWSGLLTLGSFALPGFARSMGQSTFILPGDEGVIRHGLLTRHKKQAQLPEWIRHAQRDRLYSNGHSPSDDDMVTYHFQTKGPGCGVVFNGEQAYLLQGNSTQPIGDEQIVGDQKYVLEFRRITRPEELAIYGHYADPVLFVLKGAVIANKIPLAEGGGMTPSGKALKIIPIGPATICFGQKKY